MANLPRDLAEQVGKSRTAGGGNYIQHGNYILMIGRWFYQHIQDRCIILESKAIEAEKKIVYEGQNKVEQDPNAPGSDVSSTANFDGDGKLSAPANSRAPVLGLFGFKESEVPDQKVTETLDYVLGDAQPATGMLLGVSTFPKEIRSKKGSYITGLNWFCVDKPGQGLNAADKVKARLDAFKISTDEGLRITREQLAAARAAGAGPSMPTEKAASPSGPSTAAPSLPDAPPSVPAAPPSIPVVDPFAGWTQHPQNPDYFFRGQELKKKAELLAMAGK